MNNKFYKNMRLLSMGLGYFMAVLLVAVAIICLKAATEPGIGMQSAFAAIACGLLALLLFRQAEAKRKGTSRIDRQKEEQTKISDIFSVWRACPDCGKRLAVCIKDENETTPPVLNVIDTKQPAIYYCPDCGKSYEVDGEYSVFEVEKRTLPESSERVYHVNPSYLQNQVKKRIWLFGALAALFLGILVWQLIGSIQNPDQIAFLGVIIAFAPLCMFGLMAMQYYKVLQSAQSIGYQPTPEGLILRDIRNQYFFRWDEFRIARRMEGGSCQFDTEQGAFFLSDVIEDGKELIGIVLERAEKWLAKE